MVAMATAAFICLCIAQVPVAYPTFFGVFTYEYEIITHVCIKIIVNYLLGEYKNK
jgi:hypothetical protein